MSSEDFRKRVVPDAVVPPEAKEGPRPVKGIGDRLARHFTSHPERADRLAALVERVFRRRHQLVKNFLLTLLGKAYPIFLEYEVHERHRFGHDRPGHPELHALLDEGRERYASLLRGFLDLHEVLADIPTGREDAGPDDPTWVNDFFGGLDGVALYGLLVQQDPKRFIEVGSGTSTKFARRAIAGHGLRTRITSIDPAPRAEVDRLCDVVIRERLENLDLGMFDEMVRDDILFIDGSHRSFMNTDVTVFFLEMLPRLPDGVLVHLHDIPLPFDYPPGWVGRYFSEAYLLAAYLLGGGKGAEIVLPNAFVTEDRELSEILKPFWEDPRMVTTTPHGSSFWLRIRR